MSFNLAGVFDDFLDDKNKKSSSVSLHNNAPGRIFKNYPETYCDIYIF